MNLIIYRIGCARFLGQLLAQVFQVNTLFDIIVNVESVYLVLLGSAQSKGPLAVLNIAHRCD